MLAAAESDAEQLVDNSLLPGDSGCSAATSNTRRSDDRGSGTCRRPSRTARRGRHHRAEDALDADPPARRSRHARRLPADVQPAAGRRRRLRVGRQGQPPIFVDVIGPYQKWGGDNSDAFYQLAPIDPNRTYRVTGNRGDSVYLSITVYGGPDDGHYSNRIVGTMNDRSLEFDGDGNFEFTHQPRSRSRALAQARRRRRRRTHPRLSRRTRRPTGGCNGRSRRSTRRRAATTDRADLTRRLRLAKTWLNEQVSFIPTRIDPPNEIAEPYPVPEHDLRLVGRRRRLRDGRLRPATRAGAGDRRARRRRACSGTSACGIPCCTPTTTPTSGSPSTAHTSPMSPTGRGEIVVSDTDPGHPNWVSTAGRRKGLIWLRWFLPEETPKRPTCRVVDVAEVIARDRRCRAARADQLHRPGRPASIPRRPCRCARLWPATARSWS